MKIATSLLILGLLCSLVSQAMPLAESLEKLQSYSSEDLKVSESRTKKEVGDKVQEMLTVIDQSIETALTENKEVPSDLLKQLARVSVLTFSADPSEAAAELLLPLYRKHTKAFDKAIKALPKKDQTELQKSLRSSAREDDEGNG